jgi:hypothetical protein
MDEIEFELTVEQCFRLEQLNRVLEDQISTYSPQELVNMFQESMRLQMQYTNIIKFLVKENSRISLQLINALSLLEKNNTKRKIDLPKI